MKKLTCLTALFCTAAALAGEIGFVEDFAIATNRVAVLEQLIPGTEEHYYYHCLHYQHTGRFEEAQKTLDAWIKRYGYTARVEEIRNRQALLTYRQNPDAALALIRQRLDLRFDHQKQQLNPKTDHPRALDQNAITREVFRRQALARYSNSMQGFEDTGLDHMPAAALNADLRRDLLRRLQLPDYPNLPRLVVDDLNTPNHGGFGYLPIHASLTQDQLDACLELMPALINDARFINTYLSKLHPGGDVDWRNDRAEEQAYLDRMLAFGRRLSPAYNSLKAHLLYRRLDLDRRLGIYDRDRFTEYLRLPRRVPYALRSYLERPEHRDSVADLNADYSAVTRLPMVGGDEPLVRDFLAHFLLEADNYDAFADLVDSDYLKAVFAETKILAGIGDMERWYSLLPPAQYQALKERVDIELLPVNLERFGAGEPVRLSVAVKNVPSLIVKTYVVNTLNYYLLHGEEITTDADLDGLVANEERVVAYKQPPLRRHVETFDLPNLKAPGVYVIEFIGNGRSSRALVRLGRLTFTQRVGAAGHAFTVYDSDDKPLPKAALWFGGREYAAGKEGEILIPFSTAPSEQPLIVVHDGFAALHRFQHLPEAYQLQAGFFADREALLAGRTCTLLVRPDLSLHDVPADVTLIEEPTLTIATVDREGIASSQVVPDFKLHNDQESTHTFRVPENLASIAFTLKGKVQNLSQGKKQDLEVTRAYALNGLDATAKIEDLHVRRVNGRYVCEVLGKSGESKSARPVQAEVKHREFRDTLHFTLQTDEAGRVDLGELRDIERVMLTGPEGTEHSWLPAADSVAYPPALHARVGDTLALPLPGPAAAEKRLALTLLEWRGDTFARDWTDSVTLTNGVARIGDLPAGDYHLRLKQAGVSIRLRITAGHLSGEHLVSPARFLEAGARSLLRIASVEARPGEGGAATNGTLRIQLAGATKETRVHVFAGRFHPAYSRALLFEQVGAPTRAGLFAASYLPPLSQYVSGRDIGDEFRYVLERRLATIFPGNMLKRPSLLLHPWSTRKTEMGTQVAQGGEAYEAAPPPAPAMEMMASLASYGGMGPGGDDDSGFPKYDFLPSASILLANLRPDGQGVVTLERAKLGNGQEIQVLALDGADAAYREVSLPRVTETPRDLRLAAAFDPAKHFAEQKEVTVLKPGTEFVVEDVSVSKMELYDSLAAVYGLYRTLSGDATLAEFGFILDWPDLKPERKRELYSKYACHELNVFLSRKDPEFFKAAGLPALKNKKDPTFMDHWLTGADLTPYLDPWAFGRLNIPERILLGKTIRERQADTARHVDDLFDLVPPDLERFNRLFQTALQGSALQEGDRLGLADKAAELGREKKEHWSRYARNADESQQAQQPQQPMEHESEREEPLAELSESVAFMDAGAPAADTPAAQAQKLHRKRAMEKDAGGREETRRLYRRLDKTEEWVENNYYHLPIAAQAASLVTVNGFWKDYADYDGKGPFLSANVAEASRNFTEMLLALAVLDLPFKAPEHKTDYREARLALTPGGAAVAFHRQVRETAAPGAEQLVLVGQNFFALDDRYRHENNERFDKFVTKEFQARRVYGCQVVLTNPTSTRRKVDALLQIPKGALPVQNGFYTRSVLVQLDPFSTRALEYHFYFPLAADYPHYPVHVAQRGVTIAGTAPFTFHVVDELSEIDREAWSYLSQHGTDEDVLRFLREQNVDRVDLGLIAFRMREAGFFGKALPLLRGRHVFHPVLWSYGVHHKDEVVIREYLPNTPFADQCGLFIASPLLTSDPVERRRYEHKEYWPLVNPRVYRLGRTRTILNEAFFQQYTAFLSYLQYRPELDDEDLAVTAVYLLLQDRIEEALAFFGRIRPERLASRLQYDYLKAYLLMSSGEPAAARAAAAAYRDYPVDRWRSLFLDVLAQVEEIEGQAARVLDKENREQQQTQLADTETSLDLAVEQRRVTVRYRNADACRVRYYPMDVELLFSRNPFSQDVGRQFSVIRPHREDALALPKGRPDTTFDLPAEYRDRNVLIEISAGGVSRSQAYYPNSLNVQVTEPYGQLQVLHAGTGKPVAKTYVKVYARMQGGAVQFFKDGYTDLRGRFDYTSLNTDELERVERFALLIVSESAGALVREAAPPKR